MTLQNLLPILIVGIIILDISFIFQIWNIWTKKHSHGLSLTAWTINFIGRVIWVVYGMLLSTDGGIVLTVGQGLCGLMSIPIIYYIIRNRHTNGEYIKDNFSHKLFFARVVSVALLFALIIVSTCLGFFAVKGHYKEASETTILVVSIIGSAFTGLSFLPQTIKTLKTRNTKSTSVYLCIAFIIGNVLMISYLLFGVVTINVAKYISGVVFTSTSVFSMLLIAIIKIVNIIKNNESST